MINHYHEKPLLHMTAEIHSQIFHQIIALKNYVDVIHSDFILGSITHPAALPTWERYFAWVVLRA